MSKSSAHIFSNMSREYRTLSILFTMKINRLHDCSKRLDPTHHNKEDRGKLTLR